MKILIVFAFTLFSLTCLSQDMEREVCKCIHKNTKSIDFNYLRVTHDIESNLIENGVIQNDFNSKKEQVKFLATGGNIDKVRTIEHILFEQIGYKSLQFCTALHTYSQNCKNSPELFRMFGELNSAEISMYDSKNYKKLQQDRAHILLKYWPNNPAKLWNMILIEFLYTYTKTPEMKLMDETFLKFEEQFKKSNNQSN